MSQESLGFVKLEWTCPKCGSRNPGPQKTCSGCGAPQPEQVQFESAEQQEIITDQAEIEKAKAGPDVHCAFCGARNPAGSKECLQCGADMTQGVRRESGRVVGAHSSAPIKKVACSRCGAENPQTALQCVQCGAPMARQPEAAAPTAAPAVPKTKVSPIALIVGGLLILCCLVGLVVFVVLPLVRSDSQTAVVNSVYWTSSITIEALRPAAREDWIDRIPAQAEVQSCSQKLYRVQDEPAPNAVKVCGTPYQVDKGSGFAEVVQDCQYEIYQDFCDFTVLEWQQVDIIELRGQDLSPRWPDVQLTGEQRQGERQQVYSIVFQTSGGQYTYTTRDLNLYQQCQIGSQWVLNINALGGVMSIEPAQ
jgi:ribosomal protein L40E